ncbi:hypothetical protein HNQ91_002450 [Filimonas zeae]|uniref:hypothetical protein n=1 Tax=Filimonas zeae TaxID=1737353 RepID=UPI001665D986|nr:hypothetical protein [Filimonas zeae]MDR6339399.1 hypothetical protein [Filimonas zeae]
MRIITAFVSLLVCSLLQAQDPVAVRQEKMSKVQFLIGNWDGKGWMLMDGKKEYFNQTEKVTGKLDNAVIIVEGTGTVPETGKVIHHALALLSYDAMKKQYRWTSATTRVGNMLDVVPEVEDNKFVWMINSPVAGKIKYTITLDNGDWLEKGEISKDGGQTWVHYFEMRLQKK